MKDQDLCKIAKLVTKVKERFPECYVSIGIDVTRGKSNPELKIDYDLYINFYSENLGSYHNTHRSLKDLEHYINDLCKDKE